MGASKQKSTSESTSTTTPFAQADLQFGLNQNRNLFNTLQGRTYPDFSTVAGFSPTTETALDQITARGLSGSPLNATAQNTVSDLATYGAFGPEGGADKCRSNIFSADGAGRLS